MGHRTLAAEAQNKTATAKADLNFIATMHNIARENLLPGGC
jgi:hypothetical protein